MSVNPSVYLSLWHCVYVYLLTNVFYRWVFCPVVVVYVPLVLLVSLAGLGWLCLLCLLVVDSYFICLRCRYSALSLHT